MTGQIVVLESQWRMLAEENASLRDQVAALRAYYEHDCALERTQWCAEREALVQPGRIETSPVAEQPESAHT